MKERKKERKKELGALGADGDVIMIQFGGGGRIVVEIGKEVLVFDGFIAVDAMISFEGWGNII